MSDFDNTTPDVPAQGEADEAQPSPSPFPTRDAPPVNIELTEVECRVLGSMVEKAFLTPDIYPMTTNALVTACNQKTNRDPVVSYAPVLVDNTLLELRQRNLVRRVHTPGSRATKHRQTLDETLSLDEAELALVSVLMLRGPQTIGELRQRTERQHGFVDLGEVEACLRGLAVRAAPLVRELERQPGHKETRWQHMLGGARTVDPTDAPDVDDDATVAIPPPPASPVPQAPAASSDPALAASSWAPRSHPLAAPASDLSSDPSPVPTDLSQRVTELEAEVVTLRSELTELAEMLREIYE